LGGDAGQWCTRTRRCPRQGCETSFYQSQTAPITAAPAMSHGTISQLAMDERSPTLYAAQRVVSISFSLVEETARDIIGHDCDPIDNIPRAQLHCPTVSMAASTIC